MGLRYPEQKAGTCFFVTSTYRDWLKYNEQLRLYGACADSLSYYARRENASIFGYVLMPNHIHLLVSINGTRLGHFMRDFKKYISQKAAQDAGSGDRNIWMPRYDRQAIVSVDVLKTKLQYIHENPVRSGLVVHASDWKWSSAADYLRDRTGPVEVCKDW